LIETHRDAALLAFVFVQLTGVAAWLGLWQSRRISRLEGWNLSAVLLLSVVTLGLMARAATLGGEIRHPEIRAVQVDETAEAVQPAASPAWLHAAGIANFVSSNPWVWPASETVHFVGLALLFGIVLLVNLRMLGMAKNLPFGALHRLLPWMVFGFAINVVTGMLFFIATPEQYIENVSFHFKIASMLLAGITVLYLTVTEEIEALGPGDDAPLSAKVIAASSIFSWAGVIYFGRMLPYIGSSF
jgi:hypothetical protein